MRFTFWRGRKGREVDLVAEVGDRILPFEVKCRAQPTGQRELKGLLELCQRNKSIDRGYQNTGRLRYDSRPARCQYPDFAHPRAVALLLDGRSGSGCHGYT